VVPGDSLWSIAAAQVARQRGEAQASVSAADVTPYWQAVCRANRSSLRSGDVNLIYPGEQITLPAT
ncbi:MAG TPA: LysM domain-containing protein, partial [Acidimicrobiia bacterium]|nr:LysM domain-containing protein [Acidimicrobiia bacterium]